MTKAEEVRFIPNDELRRLNKIATKNKKRSLTDDCPMLADGHNAPIWRSWPNIDATGWIRCEIPATPECDHDVYLDIRTNDFEKLPLMDVAVPKSAELPPDASRELAVR